VPIPFEERDKKQHKISIAHPHGDKPELSAAFADSNLFEIQLFFVLADAEYEKHKALRIRLWF